MKALGVEPKRTLPTINTRYRSGCTSQLFAFAFILDISLLLILTTTDLSHRLFFILIAQLALHHTPPLVTGNNKGGKERKRMERERGMMDKSEIQG